MRVLLVHPRFDVYGGAELVVVKLCNYLHERQIGAAILTTSIGPDVQKELKGTEVIICKSLPGGETVGGMLSLNGGIRKYMDEFSVINVHNFPANIALLGVSKPVVWMCNEPELYLRLQNPGVSIFKKLLYLLLLPLEKRLLKRYVRQIVVADNFNYERFMALYKTAATICHYGIDHDFFSRGDREKAKRKYNLDSYFTVLHVGWFTVLKNQMGSLRAVDELRSVIPNIKLVLAGYGEGAYLKAVQEYIAERRLENVVVVTGHLTRSEVRDLYHAADVLLHPIRSQGGWLAPFEALCAGLPVIVSAEMTAAELIRQNRLGLVTHDFRGAVEEVWRKHLDYKKDAPRNADWVSRNLSWARFGDGMVTAYNRAMGSASA